MSKIVHTILYRLLPLKLYLMVVSGTLLRLLRLGWGRHKESVEYIYHLEKLVKEGDVVIDIGANLGYYTVTLSSLVGKSGKIYAVEPVPPIFEVLNYNTRHCRNVELMNVALGVDNGSITMANTSVSTQGYLGTGQNFVAEKKTHSGVTFDAIMQRGSELFASLKRLDFIKCDIEGYEGVVLSEILPIIEHLRPVILLESGGQTRLETIELLSSIGYRASMLMGGAEVDLDPQLEKDIIFRPLPHYTKQPCE